MGYSVADGVRQQFTQKERDIETGLDYLNARYYASTQGRFLSTDPHMASASIWQPQSWNRYAYVLNNPLRYMDPWGTESQDPNDPNKPKPDKNNQLINPDGKPYELPNVEVTIKIKLSKGEPIGAGGGVAAGTGTTGGGAIADVGFYFLFR